MEFNGEVIKAVISVSAKTSIDAVISRFKGGAKQTIDRQLVHSRLQLYASRLLSVKTLMAPETLTSLERFYCVPHLTGQVYRRTPKSVDDFKGDHILIEGVAGQGKSMLLRHLCAKAILEEGKIGLFIELRRADRSKPLATIVLDTLREFGLPGNSESLKTLSVRRDVILFLDGFDELDQKRSEGIDRDINYLITSFPFVRIFVTSRPHVGLSRSSNLMACRIERLDRLDVHRLINKLCEETALAAALIAALDAHAGNALRLLETPLLVTLLVAQYRQTQQLPEQLAEFYDNIFPVLFERHDSFKTPFVRPRRLGLTTHVYRKIFQQFCYGSLFAPEITSGLASEIAAWAMKDAAVIGDPFEYLCDLSSTSSLIAEEGGRWSFIHASIQEYYAASYLLSGNDQGLAELSDRLRFIQNRSSADQVFRFVSEINPGRYSEFVELPYRKSLCSPFESSSLVGGEEAVEWLAARAKRVSWDKNVVDGFKPISVHMDDQDGGVIRLMVPHEAAEDLAPLVGESDVRIAIRGLAVLPIVGDRIVSVALKRLQERLNELGKVVTAIKAEVDASDRSKGFLQSLMSPDSQRRS